jgi:hypothetical protein
MRDDALGKLLTVQFFQRELLRLPHKTEYHKPGDEVEPGVETDCIRL